LTSCRRGLDGELGSATRSVASGLGPHSDCARHPVVVAIVARSCGLGRGGGARVPFDGYGSRWICGAPRNAPSASLDARTARQAAGSEKINLAVLDVVLPDADGVELPIELKAPLGESIPMIFLSSESEVRSRVQAADRCRRVYGKALRQGTCCAPRTGPC
jgi:CheY-like chemotaxis protein